MSNVCHTLKREKWGHAEYVSANSAWCFQETVYSRGKWENSALDELYENSTKF